MKKQKETFKKAVEDFKKYSLKNYGFEIHVYFKKESTSHPSLKDLETIVMLKLKDAHQEYNSFESFKDLKTRKRSVILHKQIYSYIAHIEYEYSKSAIARHLNQDHTSVIHSIRSVSDALDTNDKLVMSLYYDILIMMKDYVGFITENTRIQSIT